MFTRNRAQPVEVRRRRLELLSEPLQQHLLVDNPLTLVVRADTPGHRHPVLTPTTSVSVRSTDPPRSLRVGQSVRRHGSAPVRTESAEVPTERSQRQPDPTSGIAASPGIARCANERPPEPRPALSEPGVQADPFASYDTASAAAPMIPALLRCVAGTMGVVSFSSGRNSSACLDTPPPTMRRSGLSRNSR